MEKSRTKKIGIIIGAIVLVIIVIVVVSSLTSKKPTQTSGGLVSSNNTTPTAPSIPENSVQSSRSLEIVALLKNLSVIRLNTSVFSYPAFSRLKDISILLPIPATGGRTNPFAPIGGTAAPATTTTTVTPVPPVVPGTTN